MPLGFLRKKRTRDSKEGISSAPTSPVTPTAESRFSQSAAVTSSPVAAAASQSVPRSSAASTQQSSRASDTAAEQQQNKPMNTLPVPQSAYQAVSHTPSPGTDPQANLPRIANLINPPQHDIPATYQQQQGVQYVQHVQQPATAGGVVSAQEQKKEEQQQQQQHYHYQQQQQQQQPYHQQQQLQSQQGQLLPQEGQARVTKGKYSLNDFDILRTLGTGSFGRVHLVQSRHNHRFYAIKVLKKAQVVKMKQVEHTNDERRMLSEVKHPFLITLWGTFQDAKNLYMVMDFVEGGELFSLLRKSGVRPRSCDECLYRDS